MELIIYVDRNKKYSIPIESINYDYLPGEPESRKVLYVTLRFPELSGDAKGKRIYIKTDATPYATLPSGYYHINDVHGRNVVLETPSTTKINLINSNGSETKNNPYLQCDPRAGRYMQPQRPMNIDPSQYSKVYY